MAEFSASFGLLVVEFSVDPLGMSFFGLISTQATRKWRSQLDEFAIELDFPIASRRAKPDILTLNLSTRRLFSTSGGPISAQGIRKLRYDVQRKREDRALCPTILQRNSAWA